MTFGLKESDLAIIIQTIQNFPDIDEVILFGSRALNRHKKGSDIDLALKGPVQETTASALAGKLNEESPLPYMFDVVSYETITNQALSQHIDRVSVSIYKKTL